MTSLLNLLGSKSFIRGGPFGSKLTQADYRESGIPVIRGSNMGRDGRFIGGEFAFVSIEKYHSDLQPNAAYPGDIIITQRGTLGQVSIVPNSIGYPKLVISQSQMAITVPPEKADRDFLYYFFSSPFFQSYIENHQIQTGVPHINLSLLREVEFTWPEPSAQTAIGGILSALDDKIELNQRMNETLEQMAQATFKDWFIDFGPVRRKQEGASDPKAIMGGLVQDAARAMELAALFPDAFGEDGLPEGWRPGTLDQLATALGHTVDPATLDPAMPYIGLEHMPRKSIVLDSWGASGSVSSNKTRFEAGQILFGKLRPYFHKVGIAAVDGVSSTDIVILDAMRHADRPLVACCVSSDEFVAFTDKGSDGTKMPRTSWPKMKGFGLAIAPENVRDAFEGIALPMHQKIVASVAENRTLAEARDYLLPKLMSGEVRVRGAEKLRELAI